VPCILSEHGVITGCVLPAIAEEARDVVAYYAAARVQLGRFFWSRSLGLAGHVCGREGRPRRRRTRATAWRRSRRRGRHPVCWRSRITASVILLRHPMDATVPRAAGERSRVQRAEPALRCGYGSPVQQYVVWMTWPYDVAARAGARGGGDVEALARTTAVILPPAAAAVLHVRPLRVPRAAWGT
jgi:hypothetical protein